MAKDAGASAVIPSSGTLTAPTPDVRVTVNAGWSESAIQPMRFALIIAVQNHSPIPVYLNAIYLETTDDNNSIVVPNGDYLSDEYQRPRELQPGRSYTLSMDPAELAKYQPRSRLACAAAKDEVGRVYRSRTDELSQALYVLFEQYMKPKPPAIEG